MEEFVFIFSKASVKLEFKSSASVRFRQIAHVKSVLLSNIPKEQQISPSEVASFRLIAGGRELRDKDTLQKIAVLPGIPKNIHVGIVKISPGTPALISLEGFEPRKPSTRLCCDRCVIW